MIVQKLSLINFKNHSEKSFDFRQINCFVGNNGVGKTNILDALHYLSVGKSFLGNSDFQNIMQDTSTPLSRRKDFFSIEGQIDDGEKESVIKIQLPKEAKKIIKRNDKTYERLSDHIGFLPSVMISPYDSNLISDGGESRRKFLDGMISQTDSEYLYNLIQYQKTLKQRNALLKYFAKNRTFDADSLEIYNEPLEKFGAKIFEKRKSFIEKLNPVIQHFYQVISGGKETISVIYESDLDLDFDSAQSDNNSASRFNFASRFDSAQRDNAIILKEAQQNEESQLDKDSSFRPSTQNDRMLTLLKQNLEKDRVLTYTSKGIHKDDLLFEMNENPLKKFGSQGQQKSFLISLKLAQMNLVKELTGKTPILLLDDIFDKLDDTRVSQLIALVNQENFGQIFITDTHRERTESVVKRINEESKIFEI